MSLKVIHTRPDGTQVPIKVSIWDAFKGVPKPKASPPPPCACCGKVGCKTKAGGKDTPRYAANANANVDNKGKAKTGNQKEDNNSLTKDDRTMLRMKRENKQWADILVATDNYNHVHELKARWKVIDPSKDGNKNNNNTGKKNDKNKSTNNADREETNRKKKEEGLRIQAEKKAAKEAAKGGTEYATGEATKPTSLPTVYDRNKGGFLAAKHFDKTGDRIHWREALKMAESK